MALDRALQNIFGTQKVGARGCFQN